MWNEIIIQIKGTTLQFHLRKKIIQKLYKFIPYNKLQRYFV